MRPGGTIVICSRHSLLVSGFRTVIAQPAGFLVEDCAEPEGLKARLAAIPPEMALIDVNCGETVPFFGELKSIAPATGLILWADAVSPEFAHRAIGSGVHGILRKDAAADQYFHCLDSVSAGRLWLDDDLTQKLLRMRSIRLSPRERQLVSLLTQGLRNKEIAWRMNITEGTAKVYLSRLFEKTGASDRFELAMFVLQNLEIAPRA